MLILESGGKLKPTQFFSRRLLNTMKKTFYIFKNEVLYRFSLLLFLETVTKVFYFKRI